MRIVRRTPPALDAAWPDSVHPVLRRVCAARGLGPGDLAPRLSQLLPPDGMPGLAAAAARLCRAIERDERILVVGDFDADGATGTAVAVRGLTLLGATRIGFRVPHRLHHGYGLSAALVADILADGPRPDLLLTVDSGVACHDGVAAARAAGIAVVVSDHHLPGPTLPQADALVNPCLAGSGFGSRALAGVGVVFYLLLAVRRSLRQAGRFGEGGGPDLSVLLDLVALGTVADMVPLDRNNRVLVAAGLRRMRAGHCQPGVAALAQVSGRQLATLCARDLGFAIAPRLNAAGRLDDMQLGIACLLAADQKEGLRLAGTLDAINAERRALQRETLEDAERIVAAVLARCDGTLPPGVCVQGEDWHPGVIGLVASRLKDRLNRPVVALAPGGEDGLLRGSARSIPGVHVRDVLADVAARSPGLLPRFGGHAMAAGLSLATGDVAAFGRGFADAVGERLGHAPPEPEILSDGELGVDDFCRPLAEAIRFGLPWGQGCPEPVFDGVFAVDGWRRVGEDHLRMDLRTAAGQRLPAIAFGAWRDAAPPARLHVAYELVPDDWRGGDAVQLVVRHHEAA